MKDIVIIGAGNPDIIRLIEEINDDKSTYNVFGFLEKKNNFFKSEFMGYPILGGDELIETEFKKCCFVNNVAYPLQKRFEISQYLTSKFDENQLPNIKGPNVSVKYVKLGIGNIIYNNAILSAGSKLGNFNIIYYGSIVGHEVKVGNCNLIAANVTLGGRSVLGNRNEIGNHSVISLKVKITDDIFVGVGSVVTNSIFKSKRVFGNPAKTIN